MLDTIDITVGVGRDMYITLNKQSAIHGKSNVNTHKMKEWKKIQQQATQKKYIRERIKPIEGL